MVTSRNPIDRAVDILITGFLLLLAATAFLPLINTLAISLSSKAAVTGGLVSLWPVGFNLFSYEYIIQDDKFWRAFGISLLRVALGASLIAGR